MIIAAVAFAGFRYHHLATGPIVRAYSTRRALHASPPSASHVAFRETKINDGARVSTFDGVNEWKRLADLDRASWPIYVGRRRSGTGEERVIVVSRVSSWSRSGNSNDPPNVQTYVLRVAVYTRGGLLQTLQPLGPPTLTGVCLPRPTLNSFMAGVPDPNDPARFTINYRAGDATGTLEAILQPDDSVVLRIVDGPGLISQNHGFRAAR